MINTILFHKSDLQEHILQIIILRSYFLGICTAKYWFNYLH
jgi:hypothetical protein